MAAADSSNSSKDSKQQQQDTSERKPAQDESWSSDEEDSDYYSADEDEKDPKAAELAAKTTRRRRKGNGAKKGQGDKDEESEEEESDIDEEDEVIEEEDLWNFPIDEEGWREEHLGEKWADHWGDETTVGYDPEFVDPEDMDEINKLRSQGKGPPNTPFYVPYRQYYPLIPDNHPDIETPEDVVEELERMEEFLKWASYVFKDGSCYEGTVWDDLAHGKGVYTTPLDLCRYEGEWFQNMMQGHGVFEVDLPVAEPPPDSKEAEKMKQQGAILKSDYLNSFDKEWLKKDIEDLTEQYGDLDPVPFEDDPLWVKRFGHKPEKGHYKYAGQWKHNRMHGCGVYEINGRPIWGKFYFGELLPDSGECPFEHCALHSSLAEVAAAKARMFVNKPDGMVRELKGPYTDPSHPYMYEEEDVWMAPGFINAYYKVPEVWKVYVEEVDQEREMWLNSFIKSPFRIPMPPELEYWWSQDEEFVVLGNTPTSTLEYNPENVAKAKEGLEGEVLLHVPTGNIINWTTDKDGQFRLFWQPFTKDGVVKPELAIPLPLGFDEFMEQTETDQVAEKKQGLWEKISQKWKETIKEFQQMRQQEEEQERRRWQEEDLVKEKRLKLKAAEAKFAEQIEDAEIEAQYRELYEDLLERENQLEVSEEQTVEDTTILKKADSKRQEEEVKEDGTTLSEASKEMEDEDEDDDDDGDDTKPSSFGRVAMVEPQATHGREETSMKGNRQKPDTSAPSFPTAFASLSLASHLVIKEMLSGEICQAMQGLLPQRHHSQQITKLGMGQITAGYRSGELSIQIKDAARVSFSFCKRKDLRLIAVFPKNTQHVTRSRLHSSKKFVEGLRRKTIACMKSHKSGTSGRPDHMLMDVFCSRKFDSNKLWCEPKHCFLSMAFPLKI